MELFTLISLPFHHNHEHIMNNVLIIKQLIHSDTSCPFNKRKEGEMDKRVGGGGGGGGGVMR